MLAKVALLVPDNVNLLEFPLTVVAPDTVRFADKVMVTDPVIVNVPQVTATSTVGDLKRAVTSGIVTLSVDKCG